MKIHLWRRLRASQRRGNGLLFWEIMNSSCEASHGVSCELTLSLQDLLAIVVVLCRRWTQHTLLAQTIAQTKVIIKNYYCGSTGWTKGTPTFFPSPCPPIALWGDTGCRRTKSSFTAKPSLAPQWQGAGERSTRCLPLPTSFLLLATAANPLPLPCLTWGKVPLHYSESCGGTWLRLRLRPHAQIRAHPHLPHCRTKRCLSAIDQGQLGGHWWVNYLAKEQMYPN